jgi:hypothetical protein
MAPYHWLLFWVLLGCSASYSSVKAVWYLPTFLPSWTPCKDCSFLSRFAWSTKKSEKIYVDNLSLARFVNILIFILYYANFLSIMNRRGYNVWHFTLTLSWVTCIQSRHKINLAPTMYISESQIHHRTITVKYLCFPIDCIKVFSNLLYQKKNSWI